MKPRTSQSRSPDATSPESGWPEGGWITWGFVVMTILPLLPSLMNADRGDCPIYQRAVEELWSGVLPYRDRPFEYPPYALPFFLIPDLLSDSERSFRVWFGIEMLLLDFGIKALLIHEGKRRFSGWKVLLPCAVFALDGWLQAFVYLKRYDLVPSGLVLLAVLLVIRGRALGAGVVLASAIAAKIYPAVLVLPLLALTRRYGRARRFVSGLALGAAPLGLLAIMVPWWRFASMHAQRGLEAESLAASLIWWLHRLAGFEADWVRRRAWFEVAGPAATALHPVAVALFFIATLASIAVATARVGRDPPASVPALATALLLPLVGFIAFSPVLSPQYMIWCFPLIALASIEGATPALVALIGATLLIRGYFPSYDYWTGLRLPRATLLLARNLALVAAWIWLIFPGKVMLLRGQASTDLPGAA